MTEIMPSQATNDKSGAACEKEPRPQCRRCRWCLSESGVDSASWVCILSDSVLVMGTICFVDCMDLYLPITAVGRFLKVDCSLV